MIFGSLWTRSHIWCFFIFEFLRQGRDVRDYREMQEIWIFREEFVTLWVCCCPLLDDL